MNDTTRRMPLRTIRVGAIPPHADFEQCYFPINANQVRDLEEATAIRIEMLNLSKKAEDAAKYVFQEMLWPWLYGVKFAIIVPWGVFSYISPRFACT